MDEVGATSGALVVLGLIVLLAARLVSDEARHSARDIGSLVLYIIGGMMIALGMLVPLGIVGWLAVLFIIGMAFHQRRLAERRALLSLLAVAAQRQMPLAPAVEAFADDSSLHFADRVRRLAAALRGGQPLPQALEREGLLPEAGLVAARMGTESGTLGQSLGEAVRAGTSQAPLWQALIGRCYYFTFLSLAAVGILTFVMIKIVPAFRAIFEDFEMELPAMTEILIWGANAAAQFWFLWWPLWMLLFVLFAYQVFYPLGWAPARVPFVERFVRQLDTAVILRALAVSTEHGQPLPAGLGSLARSYPKRWVRRRLARAEQDVLRGGDWLDSLQDRGLLRAADAAVLQAAQRLGNLPWALREVAESGERRLAARLATLVQMVSALAILAVALPVGFIVVALFLPLIKIMASLT